ncbi:hypothetical protein [Arachidicoccus ginsenosidivorans]|uniref:hypothetical protein n=1 Tax=Arachidicoccus ginsenosidivorans TaxID=496057 RepID=UPI001CEFACB0|nr:hypothetical protein [Arachidicoccus ginsenosidivorans]
MITFYCNRDQESGTFRKYNDFEWIKTCKSLMVSIIVLLFLPLISCEKYLDPYNGDQGLKTNFYKVDWVAAADSSTNSFINRYWNTTSHVFNNTYDGEIAWNDYWPEAHGLDVMVDAYLRTKSENFKQDIYDWYEGVRKKNWYSDDWENVFYDDMGWHCLAHMRALEATGDQRYAKSSKDLWTWITQGWSDYDGEALSGEKNQMILVKVKVFPLMDLQLLLLPGGINYTQMKLLVD